DLASLRLHPWAASQGAGPALRGAGQDDERIRRDDGRARRPGDGTRCRGRGIRALCRQLAHGRTAGPPEGAAEGGRIARMKLASLRGGRDGRLLVVSRDLERAVEAAEIASTLQAALDDWATAAPQLAALAERLERDAVASFAFRPVDCAALLPRAYQWADGSAYVNHVELLRRARDAELPPGFWTDPLMYQGGSAGFLGPCEPIPMAEEGWGLDFEAEIAVVTDDVAMGCDPAAALAQVRLLLLVNDVSLRRLIPAELAKGFGFFQSKPAS